MLDLPEMLKELSGGKEGRRRVNIRKIKKKMKGACKCKVLC